MNYVYYYKFQTTKDNNEALNNYFKFGAIQNDIYVDKTNDQKKKTSYLNYIKNNILDSAHTLVINDIDCLGKTSREIIKELDWLKDNNIPVIILNQQDNISQSRFISQDDRLYKEIKHQAEIEISNMKRLQKIGIQKAKQNGKQLGRHKIDYPENWHEYYLKWKKKEITAVEFMNSVHLKKTTFYTLLKYYRYKMKEKV